MSNAISASLQPNIRSSGWILIAAFIMALPFSHLFELPVALMAIGGLWICCFRSSTLRQLPGIKVIGLVWLGLWLPMLLSLPDAVNFQRSAETTLTYLRFPLVAIFVITTLQNEKTRERLLNLIGIWLSLTALFVLAQAFLGGGLAAPAWGGVIGIIAKQRACGHIMAVLSPIYFYWVWKTSQRYRWLGLIVLPVFIGAILLCSARVAWIMLIVGACLTLAQLFYVEKMRWHWKTIISTLAALGVIVTLSIQYSPLGARITQTAGLFSGKYEQINAATSVRLPIWKVAVNVLEDHYFNGIGPRGFRYIYAQYAPPDDFWMNLKPPVYPTHPHQQLLEIAVETGIIGVIGYFFALLYWIGLSFKAAFSGTRKALPWMIAVILSMMPINAHMAFYASFWSCMIWWLIAISVGFFSASKEVVSAQSASPRMV